MITLLILAVLQQTRVEPAEGGDLEDLRLLKYSADGKTLLTAGNHRICRWELATGKRLSRIETSMMLSADVSPDESVAAIGESDSESFILVDLSSGNQVWRVLQDDQARFLRFSPDGKTLAEGG
jgi:WD40 repeat protein